MISRRERSGPLERLQLANQVQGWRILDPLRCLRKKITIFNLCFLFKQVDVYSFGVLLCEMCIRELPVPQEIHNQIGQVTNGALRRLIQRCVQRDPETRSAMSEEICKLEELAKCKRV